MHVANNPILWQAVDPRRCKYTNELKFLVELEDRVDDELLVRLKLEEEMSAINGDYTDDCFAFGIATEEGDEPGAGKEGNKKVVLEEWPEIIEDNLILRVKKYKDHAVKRKSTFKATEDRLSEEKCTGQERLALSYVFFCKQEAFKHCRLGFSGDHALVEPLYGSCAVVRRTLACFLYGFEVMFHSFNGGRLVPISYIVSI